MSYPWKICVLRNQTVPVIIYIYIDKHDEVSISKIVKSDVQLLLITKQSMTFKNWIIKIRSYLINKILTLWHIWYNFNPTHYTSMTSRVYETKCERKIYLLYIKKCIGYPHGLRIWTWISFSYRTSPLHALNCITHKVLFYWEQLGYFGWGFWTII